MKRVHCKICRKKHQVATQNMAVNFVTGMRDLYCRHQTEDQDVAQFIISKKALFSQMHTHANERQKAFIIKDQLLPEIRVKLVPLNITTVDELVIVAVHISEDIKEAKENMDWRSYQVGPPVEPREGTVARSVANMAKIYGWYQGPLDLSLDFIRKKKELFAKWDPSELPYNAAHIILEQLRPEVRMMLRGLEIENIDQLTEWVRIKEFQQKSALMGKR